MGDQSAVAANYVSIPVSGVIISTDLHAVDEIPHVLQIHLCCYITDDLIESENRHRHLYRG